VDVKVKAVERRKVGDGLVNLFDAVVTFGR
jgi:hypothetical protein